ncbi:FtsX-like permease family protein [Streptomyces sp. NBC_00338]|uniref:FtsX-like permease family protein n=1 Tax=Streptomyces sp. NBC_00338 TaxID=2975715 RepID=UPI00225782A5|nr:FtsX-like permease family protein [Streptomyces sp. NBC_00338]MCX5140280.1 ABC transporter permease [Streptomyces sp. NBC_00338]
MKADARIAWALARGSDRREWWRFSLTAVGALLATVFALAAITVTAVRGQVSIPFGHGLLDQPGERQGVVAGLVLLLIPVLGLLGQCARIGAVHRDRRMAGLRLAGASPARVRRISALESASVCLAGSLGGLVVVTVALAVQGHTPPATAWAGFVAVVLAVPVAGALVSVSALRRVVASPLGEVRRVRPDYGHRTHLTLILATLLVAATALLLALGLGRMKVLSFPLLVFALVFLTGAGAVWLAGASSAALGRRLTLRAKSPAVLIAASRLRDDPWAVARTHAALLLVTVVGVGVVGVREVMLARLQREGSRPAESLDFYTTGADLAGAAVLVALVISLLGLAVGTAESLATRRRGLAVQAAAGVPHRVLARTVLLETALPLAPAMLLAGIGGMAVHLTYSLLVAPGTFPSMLPLLVPVAVYGACLLASATSLPLLRRMTRPSELRFT